MTSLFDEPFELLRHIRYDECIRETIILNACLPSYQHFLRQHRGRTIVVDGDGNVTIVIAGEIKIGMDPPMSIPDFLTRVFRGERPWERGRAGGQTDPPSATLAKQMRARHRRLFRSIPDTH